ncbi:hypothetical protein JB92DRAFT_2838694 [Gautieria morchelliformis]|nr:hypothetical protein JB92DRAFT_2838694 [Gautieria morchelliformis]
MQFGETLFVFMLKIRLGSVRAGHETCPEVKNANINSENIVNLRKVKSAGYMLFTNSKSFNFFKSKKIIDYQLMAPFSSHLTLRQIGPNIDSRTRASSHRRPGDLIDPSTQHDTARLPKALQVPLAAPAAGGELVPRDTELQGEIPQPPSQPSKEQKKPSSAPTSPTGPSQS